MTRRRNQPIPRKGIETTAKDAELFEVFDTRRNQPIPRKGIETLTFLLAEECEPVATNQFPARGLKQKAAPSKLPLSLRRNQPIPRKGIETDAYAESDELKERRVMF